MSAEATIQPAPVVWRDQVLPPSEGKHPGLAHRFENTADFIVERDVAVTMRDGIRLYVDVVRPHGTAPVPVILSYSPYGKHGPKKFMLGGATGVPAGSVSPLAVWEGPDPDYFVRHGYAVVNADARGSWHCEGDLTVWSAQEALDGYDLIEWAAAQPWSTGRVGMSGVSYLAIVQWRIAALNPPHLAAINPWEGWNDAYRDRAYHGGIPETNQLRFTEWSTCFSLGRAEDVVEEGKRHPLIDDYWRAKTADLGAIRVPAYVVADWGDHGLHTRGSIEGFKQMASEHKWLEVHGRKKWQYYYQPDSLERLRVFFDHFLKQSSDAVLQWPRVRIEVREGYYQGAMRGEPAWPIASRQLVQLWLDARDGGLHTQPPAEPAQLSYDTATGSAVFEHRFAQATEITGSMALRLWVSTDVANDADLFVAVQKLDAQGQPVHFTFMAEYDNGPVALGWLRASHRALDAARSTPEQPWHTHTEELPLTPGEPVPLDIEILPSSTLFEAGSTLRVIIQGRDIYTFPGVRHGQLHERTRNAGQHLLHTGGRFDAHLTIPVIPAATPNA